MREDGNKSALIEISQIDSLNGFIINKTAYVYMKIPWV